MDFSISIIQGTVKVQFTQEERRLEVPLYFLTSALGAGE
jgi:hypothetical protein